MLQGRTSARSRRRRRLRRLWQTARRRVLPSQPFLLLVFTALVVLVAYLVTVSPMWVPVSTVVPVLLLAGLVLRVRALVLLYLVVAAGWFYAAAAAGEPGVQPGSLAVIVVSAAVVLVLAHSREQLGVQGTLGNSMLVDLRDRLRAQGHTPELPGGWHVDRALRSAYGESFSGDFLVSSRAPGSDVIELVLVDVSGKGQPAGTRALLLSGAFGGLLGAMSREEFLPAANAYLLRQDWDEGFATAVHVAVDLRTGGFSIAGAGHPPPAHFHAGSGRWEVLEADYGPALGILECSDYPAHEGRLLRGDALLLYTDGLVETPGRDLALGIDRLMGQAERLVQSGGFHGGADRLVDSVGAGENDDRALVLLWRE